MKKILFFTSALAGLFLAVSCQRESLEPEVSGNVVSYTIQVPGALSTKVIGEDVSAVNELVYAVYRTEATAADDYTQTETKLFQKTAVITDGKATVDFELVNNQNFRVLFWAHVNTQENPSVYTTTDLKKVTLSQSLTANVESYAAFAGSDFIKYGDNINGRTVTLVRPIAQLNIATAPGSLDIEGQTTVKMTTTGVTVTGLSTSYNVAEALAGDVATTPFTYTAAAVSGLSEQTLSVNGTDYNYVAMNYVGFAEQAGSNVEVSYTINTENVGTISNTIKNVPVKANYRTNIVGNLITSMSDYKITLDSDWADEPDEPYVVEVVSVSTAKELQDAIDDIIDGAEGNIKLEGDINLNDLVGLLSTKAAPAYGLLIPETKTVVLDLGGYTLTGNAIVDGSKVHVIVNNGTLTIMNGTLTANGTNGGSAISNNGTLTITDATVNGASSDTATGYASYAVNSQGTESKLVVNNSTINGRGVIGATEGTKVEINGGTYHTPAVAWGHAVYADGEGTEVVINDGTFSEGYEASTTNWGMYQIYSANKAKVTVNGGTFMPWDCANGYDLCTATEGTIVIYGGSFAEDPSNQNGINYVADGYGVVANENGTFTVEKLPTAAKIGDTEYLKLAEAVNNVKEGETITILEGTIEEGTIKLPASLKNVTFKGEEGAILKDMTIMAHDGNSISYEGLTFEGLTFENSRISITGWRTNGAVVKNFTVTNCIFRNLDDNTNSAPVHFNMNTHEAVNGFTFTDNVIDGATGGAKSGIYIATTGNVIINNNTFNNIVFRPALVQLADCDGVEDNVQISDNVISNTTRLQVYGSEQDNGDGTYTPVGTDKLTIAINNNIFKNITTSYYICTWGINGDSDITDNYFDGDISGRIFWNNEKPSDVTGLIAIGIYPIYTELNSDGTINKDSAYTPSTVAKIGDVEYYNLQEALNAGGEITLLRDVKLTEMAVLEAGKTATLDLNGYNITVPDATKRIYAINNKGNLTLKDSKGTGSVKARGIYNGYNGSNTDETVEGATMTVESGNFFALDSNGGAAIFNCAKAIINGGVFDGQVAAFNGRKCAETTIYGGVFRSVNNYAIQQNNGGELSIYNATVNRGFGAVGCFGGKVTIETGEFLPTGMATTTCHVVYVAAGAEVTINGGIYKMNYAENAVPDSGSAVASYYNGTLAINGGTFTAHFDNVSPVELSSGSTIKGGTYYNHAGVASQHSYITNFVAEGYELNANGEVVKK